MIKRVITGKESEKLLSIEYNPLSKEWKLSSKSGKTICCVPSERSLVKFENLKEEKKATIEKLKNYPKEKFPESRQDISLTHDRVYLALCKECSECEDIELEPFALARLFTLLAEEGFVIDWGRRKTVFVEVRKGLLESFRVVLRGGDYITQKLSGSRGISEEEAERLKRLEGLSLREVEEAVREIIQLSGYNFEGKKVLLTGGGSRLKGLKSLFSETIVFTLCEPEYAVCLGACLREVLKNPYPDFRKKGITQEEIRRIAYAGGFILVAFVLGWFAMDRLYSVERLREVQRAEFKKLFPNEPIVSLHQQVKAKVSTGEEFKLTKLFIKAQDSLKPGMKLYSFEYLEGKLTIRGEADRSLLEGLKLHSTKETPAGKVEFELVVQ